MKQLWAPWRLTYIQGPKRDGCIFCAARSADDREALVVARSAHCFVMMNLFPYNTGHVMVVPNRHQARLEHLEDGELLDLLRMTDVSVRAQGQALQPEGWNVGLNLGRAAGAGIEDHLHIHVVPRWVGDTNFMPVLGDVKVMPEHLSATYDRLADAFRQVRPPAGGVERA